MSLELAMLVPHTPRMCHEEFAPEFQRELVQGMHQVAGIIESSQPDVLLLVSCHWMSSFDHLIDATADHKGVLTAFECPDLISDIPYHHAGDKELALKIAQAGKDAGIPVKAVDDPTYVWDYGTVVPLRYLLPRVNVPVIDLSVCWAATLEETYRWGQEIGKVLNESGKRAMFASSGALSHNLHRGAHLMPSISEQAMDKQFLSYLNSSDFDSAWKMLPQYAKISAVESGGRHIALMLGVMNANHEYQSEYFGYGQSSGSANVVITFKPKA
ncbi:extradiol ring-cleavage dioxygenase [Aneurinibacillus sp. Ricciae_BoGa-3]|uniref:DODA-type extradiol aromatic ring-opening family dioxygenase n=1 Tax=Aneurinibacillus sp. Ricciae_BoGa-3 TaxID=3022697 RepID=UPI002341C151|nr:extradiol ring-cleavage dioxygenase [Aneurinibacillus sp. Ricciae_BoGa-3]WCK52322.1 extradiol ring-cleavage dioxygenase [Aneurinibacillus sp. Ricciae_BoGa-3]